MIFYIPLMILVISRYTYFEKDGNPEIIIKGDIDSEDEAIILGGLISVNYSLWELPQDQDQVKFHWEGNKNY